MTTTKRIEWAYQTSSYATKFGFGKAGCYTVELKEAKNLPAKAVAGFATIAEAEKYAESLPYHWGQINAAGFNVAERPRPNRSARNGRRLRDQRLNH